MRLPISLTLFALAACGDLHGVGPDGDTDTSVLTCDAGCDVMPDDFCDEDFNAVRYVGEGECVDGACAWPIATERCDFDCDEGRCIPEPRCEEVVCQEPPEDTCVDASTRRTYEDVGLCNDSTNECEYEAMDLSCAHGCDDGLCIPDPAEPLPDGACDDTTDCGAAADCVDDVCVCGAGYADCEGGCCPIDFDARSFDVAGAGLALTYGPDGTAYIVIRNQVGEPSDLDFEAVVYTVAPGASVLTEQFTVDAGFRDRAFDAVVRSDGTLFVVVSAGSDQIRLYEYTPGETEVETVLGAGHVSVGVGIGVDGDDTVWAAWGRSNSGTSSVYSRTVGGLNTQTNEAAFRQAGEAGIAYDPSTDSVFGYWGHRYTGDYVHGRVTLSGSTPASGCMGTEVAYDDVGTSYSVYNTYSNIRGTLCHNGVNRLVADVAVSPEFPRSFYSADLTTTGDGTAFIAFYDLEADRAHWAASRDGQRWSRGMLPALYDNTIPGGNGLVAVARRPDGGLGFFVLPTDSGMGDAVLLETQ